MRPDAITLLRDARPEPPPPALDEATLERIVASPPDRPRPRRPRRPRVLRPALAVATAIAASALVVIPGGSPNVLAQTAAALNDENSILHYRVETRHLSGAEPGAREPDAEVEQKLEVWQADGGRKERYLFGHHNGEFVRDLNARTLLIYNGQANEIVRETNPDMPSIEPREIDTPAWNGVLIGDLSRLLERARRGEENVEVVGESTVRGIDVYELRIAYPAETGVFHEPGPDSAVPVDGWRIIYVDKERFLPVRVAVRTESKAQGGEVVQRITDYVDVERLERTPENENLLEMSPHPGARELTYAEKVREMVPDRDR